MSWFETLTGVTENSRDAVRTHLRVTGSRLHSLANGLEWNCGELTTPSLAELRARAQLVSPHPKNTTVKEIVADVQSLHANATNAGAMFQVASQFNLLEMTSPSVTPEDGVGIYEHDYTQGPACAIAAGAGTIYRNYFAQVAGQLGQTAENQIDCLRDLGQELGNSGHRLWEMKNGYALASIGGLKRINSRLSNLDESQRDLLREMLRIGVHSNTQVTLEGASHLVSQAYCSAMPVSYSEPPSSLWAPFARLILEAAYEATLCAAILNTAHTSNNRLFLTLIGGGVFGNEQVWILDSIRRAISLYPDCGLEIAIVSYGRSQPAVRELADGLASELGSGT